MKHVLIVGHSHVWRMMYYNTNLAIDTSRTHVQFCGHLGSQRLNLITQLCRQVDWVIREYGLPDVLVLGTNDLIHTEKPRDDSKGAIHYSYRLQTPRHMPNFDYRMFPSVWG